MTGRELYELRSPSRVCWSELDSLTREAWEQSANPKPGDTAFEALRLERAYLESLPAPKARTPERVTIEILSALAHHVVRLSEETAILRQRVAELEAQR